MLKHIKHLLANNSLLIAVFVTVAIIYLSLGKPLPIKNPLEISFLDKILHASAYFILTATWLFTLRRNSKKSLIVIAIFLFGILMEFLQGWLTENRQQDGYDVIANTIGIILSLLFFNRLLAVFNKM